MKTLTRRLNTSLIVGTCLLSGAALASPMGFYVGGSLGSSDQNVSMSNFVNKQKVAAGSGVVDSTSFGARLFSGYRFNKYSAAEVGYTHFGNAAGSELAFQTTPTKTFAGTFKASAADISGRFFVPLADEVDPYIDLGAAYLMSTDSLSDGYSHSNNLLSFRYGGGVNFNVNQHYAFGLGWSQIQGRDKVQSADLLALNFGFYLQ